MKMYANKSDCLYHPSREDFEAAAKEAVVVEKHKKINGDDSSGATLKRANEY